MSTGKNDRRVRATLSARISGLYGIADADASSSDPARAAAALLAGGCRVLQLRCKGWAYDDVLSVARALAPRCRAVGAVFLINDHPQVAVACDADGVHVGQQDAAPADVRAIVGPRRLIGRSTHDPSQVLRALDGADYVAFGPVWPTQSAGRDKGVRGLPALAQVRALVPLTTPLVAIGGVTAARIPALISAGATSWAVIGAVAHAGDPIAATRALIDAARRHDAQGVERIVPSRS